MMRKRTSLQSSGSRDPWRHRIPQRWLRSFAAELIARSENERDRFWNDWAETMIAGSTAWLLADRPAQERRLSALFDLFISDEADYHIAMLLEERKVSNRSARAAFSSYLQLPERDTRPSVLGTTQTHLRLFDSDLMRKLTDTTSTWISTRSSPESR